MTSIAIIPRPADWQPTDVDAVPPWRPLGTATRVEIYSDIFMDSTGPDTWLCVAGMLAEFTVDVTDATWPPGTSPSTSSPPTGTCTCAASRPTVLVSSAACPPAAAE